MPIGRTLKRYVQIGVLSIIGLPMVAAAQPDIKQDQEQCSKAKTAKECQAALPVCGRVLAALEQAPSAPKLDARVGRVLSDIAGCEYEVGNYAEAEGHYRLALALQQRLYGPEHNEVAASLDSLVEVLDELGKYGEAEALGRQALTIRQKLLGAHHPEVAQSLDKLATALANQGHYEQAEKLMRQALEMKQRLLGAKHPDVALAINNLAWVLTNQGKYEEAETLFRQALEIRQKLFATQHPHVAQSLHNLGWVLEMQGNYEEAETLYRQALEIRQKVLGLHHPDVAHSLHMLGFALRDQGKYEQAEELYRQALEIQQKVLGPQHPSVARSLNDLADALDHLGKYEEAERLCRQALEMRQKLLGAEHTDVAESMDTLAGVLAEQGRYEQAERLMRQALEMRQKLLGAKHPAVALSLNQLAWVLTSHGKYDAAESLFRQALELRQKLFDAQHPHVALSLNNLGWVLEKQGKYEQAEALHRQALEIRQKVLGPQHPDVSESLNNLAWVLTSQGKYDAAEPLYRQAIEMDRRQLGAQHPEVARDLNNLAFLLMRRGMYRAAIPLFAQAAQIHENLLRSTSGETRMRSVLTLVRRGEDILYGLLLQQPTDTALQHLAMTTALLRKGRAAEAGTVVNHLLAAGLSDPSLQQRYEQWLQIRQQREALLYGNPGRLCSEAHRAKLIQLGQQAEDLESQLAAAMPELRQLQPPPFDTILPAVAARLPSDGVLLEVLWVQPLNFQAMGTEERWATPRYLAIVLSADQKIAVHDLGDAAALDRQVQAMLAALRNPGSDPKPFAQALYSQILRPLLPASARHVYLSMDGSLSLVPFDALHDGQDYLLGRKRFHYLTSGRDLLRTDTEPARNPALLLADPDFGQGTQFPRTPGMETFYQRLAKLMRLPGALREAGFIGKLLSIAPRVGAAATEAVVRASRTPWVLHIASHGLFLGGEPGAGAGGRSASELAQRKGVLIGDLATEPLKWNGDPDALSRSALVLAGAARGDQAKSAAEDGLLTGDEARSLDLRGTQLVVLSACDTGQGELSMGQGVYGMQRAFLVAGAETVVSSLWQVSDEATGMLMEAYYQKLLVEKKGKLEAMQDAMQQMREKYRHPYYWAPFQVIGSDGPLRPPASLARR